MGEAKRKERKLKNMSLAELQAELNESVTKIVAHQFREFVPQMIEEIVRRTVREEIQEYHGWLIENGYIEAQPRQKSDGQTPSGLILPDSMIRS